MCVCKSNHLFVEGLNVIVWPYQFKLLVRWLLDTVEH